MHGKAFQELPGRGHVHLGQVALNCHLAKTRFQACHVNTQGFQGAQQQGIALKTVQPQVACG